MPKGSKTGFSVGGHINIVDVQSKALKGWQANVKAAAQDAVDTQPPYEGPVYVSINFYLPRPRNHFGTGKNAGKLKQWAVMLLPDVKPDGDKLERAVWDALSGVCYVDDAQVCQNTGQKFYEFPPKLPPGIDVRVISIVATGNSQRGRNR